MKKRVMVPQNPNLHTSMDHPYYPTHKYMPAFSPSHPTNKHSSYHVSKTKDKQTNPWSHNSHVRLFYHT